MAIGRFNKTLYGSGARLPRLKIHLGVKAINAQGKEYPKAVDYFVIPDTPDGKRVKAIYGERPQELEILFLRTTIDDATSLFYRCYGKTTGLVCKGDGDTAFATLNAAAWEKAGHQVQPGIWATSETEKVEKGVEIPCAGEGYEGVEPCPAYTAKRCRRLMMLRFAVVGVSPLVECQLDTSSFYGTVNIHGCLQTVQDAVGRIFAVPLILRLVPQEVTPDGKKKIVRVLQLAIGLSAEDFLQIAGLPIGDAIALMTGQRLALPEGRGPEACARVLEGDIVQLDEEKAGEFFGDPSELPAEEDVEGPTTPAPPPAQAGLDLQPPEFPAAPPADTDGDDGLAAEADAAANNGGAKAGRGAENRDVTPSAPAGPKGAPTAARPAPRSALGTERACVHRLKAEVARFEAIAKQQGFQGGVCLCCGGAYGPPGGGYCKTCEPKTPKTTPA